MSLYDYMFSADMCVPDPHATAAQLVETIGLREPKPTAHVEYPESGWDVIFALANKSISLAPTRLELIGPKQWPETPRASNGRRIFDMQGSRACKTHASVVVTPRMDDLIDHVRKAAVRHWLQVANDEVPFDRLWIGAAEGDPGDYDRSADAGLIIEVLPSNAPTYFPQFTTKVPPEPENPADGDFIQIVSRAHFTDDLDATLKTLERNLAWEPAGPIIEDRAAGYRFASMSYNYAHGAKLKLVEPLDVDSYVGRYYSAWGPGPYAIRFAVYGLEAKAAELEERGTGFTRLSATKHTPELLAPDPKYTGNVPFEFVEYLPGATTPA